MKRMIMLITALSLAIMTASAQDWAKARLDKSPRHLEWVKVKNGKREVNSFLAFPEVKGKATAIVVIHENRGLTDWVRSVADELAEAGYIAIAPDLLSGMAPGGGNTTDFKSEDAATAGIYKLSPDQVTGDLNAVVDHVSKLPACNGKVVVAGFCWGGGQTFRLATNNKNIKAALSFYGPPPEKEEEIARINCPVYGFYGGNDNRINAMIPKATEQMKKAGKTYEPVTYEGAGHGFMRSGEDPTANREADKKARDEAWKRVKDLLKKI
ncbi:MAG: carboxymethylenebutenolidase [Verrucomicrobia bacterium]|nr:MAG: carboxymethylenebutenolidase [Verrucomicrobiota bacterium]